MNKLHFCFNFLFSFAKRYLYAKFCECEYWLIFWLKLFPGCYDFWIGVHHYNGRIHLHWLLSVGNYHFHLWGRQSLDQSSFFHLVSLSRMQWGNLIGLSNMRSLPISTRQEGWLQARRREVLSHCQYQRMWHRHYSEAHWNLVHSLRLWLVQWLCSNLLVFLRYVEWCTIWKCHWCKVPYSNRSPQSYREFLWYLLSFQMVMLNKKDKND